MAVVVLERQKDPHQYNGSKKTRVHETDNTVNPQTLVAALFWGLWDKKLKTQSF